MDVLTVGEKSYVKASVLARELGYTADYIGQLCRGKKVDAKLVGRSWYVEKDSIQSHKSTRYRSTGVKSHQAIEAHVAVHRDNRVHAVSIHQSATPSIASPFKNVDDASPRFYIHNSLKPSPRYIQDDADLLPSVLHDKKKAGHLQVDLADANNIAVTSKPEAYDFEIPPLPTIKFKGALALSEYDDDEAHVPEGGVLIHPKEVENIKKHAIKDVIRPEIVEELEIATVSHKHKHLKSTEIEVQSVTENTYVGVKEEEVIVGKSHLGIHIFMSTVLASLVVAVSLGLESRLLVENNMLVSSYGLQFDNLQASAYAGIHNITK